MEYNWVLFAIAAIGGFFMAFSNGANDVANAFASAVGSKALSVRQALMIASTLTLVGAVLLGSKDVSTLVGGVIQPDIFSSADHYILGMLSCLLAAGFFVLVSTLTGLPVSSTHAIVGAMTGVGISLGGFSTVNWPLLTGIAISWVASPFIAAFIAFWSIKLIYLFIYRPGKKTIIDRFVRFAPGFLAFACAIIAFSLIHKSSLKAYLLISAWEIPILFLALYFAFYLTARYFIGFWTLRAENSEKGTERLFRKLQIGTSSFVAFAHGSNDVANSISPVLAIFAVMKMGVIPANFDNITIPLWILCLGGIGMATGTAALGYKVIATLGEKITLITNSKGFCVDFSTAITVVFASILGIPISTTHAATGSIIGVGFFQGKKGLNFSLLAKILIAWVFTVPLAALVTVLCYWILKSILL